MLFDKRQLYYSVPMKDKKTPLKDRVRPCLSVLSENQKKKIHYESLKILSSIGVRIESKKAQKIFSRHLPMRETKGDVIRIPAEIVETSIQLAPQNINIYNRFGKLAFSLPGEARFGVGGTNLYYQDPETDQMIPFDRQRTAICVKLGERLSEFDAVSTLGIIQDVPLEKADLYQALEMTANTIKPLIVLISDDNRMPAVLDLLTFLHGDLAAKPFVMPFLNPVTPLVINKGTSDKMFAAIERNLPFIYANVGIAGGTTPIMPAAGLTLMNAELLAGLVLSQLIKERSPVLLGSMGLNMDMKSGFPVAGPMRFLMTLACADMMTYYQIPHFGTSGGKNGWGADIITTGYEWFNHLICCMGKIGLASFVGSNFRGLAFTPSLAVYGNEVIDQVRRFTKGFDLDNPSIGFDEIVSAGPGGNFVASDLTLKHFREAYIPSVIFPQLSLDEWQKKEQPPAEEILKRYTAELITSLKPAADYDEIMERGENFIRKLKK